MPSRVRPEPVIPDHQVLRMIGGGSYGEVWLARGVTGAMRAVKLVRREDFDDERTFEREFEGILQYEPVSRDHPGLVHILHIGRAVDLHENAFYYYVMELGDDVYLGTEINPVEYEARNLLTDLKNAGGKPIELDLVIDMGLRLSEALKYLHDKGLAHRDVKPSNIIFVDGKAKLADIGLVAPRGQRTFVGTEGFVPPEGPGSAQADVYGLGKILYEMLTGKDRLDFPELPDEMPQVGDKKRWQAMNQVICDVCEPRVSKRYIKTAESLADALRRIQTGRKIKKRVHKAISIALPLLLIAGLMTWGVVEQLNKFRAGEGSRSSTPTIEQEQYGYLKVLSSPEGADVYDANGEFIDVTPLQVMKMKAGSDYAFEFRLQGYRRGQLEGVVEADKTIVVESVMDVYSPPVKGYAWKDHMSVNYEAKDGYHISTQHVKEGQWRRYRAATNDEEKPPVTESNKKNKIVWVTEEQARRYTKWKSEDARKNGYLSEEQDIYPLLETNIPKEWKKSKNFTKGLRPFKTIVKDIPFVRLEVRSVPSGANVSINGQLMGQTPLYLNRIRPSLVNVTLNYEGYRKVNQTLDLKDNSSEKLSFKLEKDNSVVFGEKWENSLGMKFVPIGTERNLLVSIWETRISDYKKYISESEERVIHRGAGFPQQPNHPVLQISRDSAESFCEWLTTTEQQQERIPLDARYRLLTDLEWSLVAGLREDAEATPAERDFDNILEVFPWGTIWPPEKVGYLVGNLADESAKKAFDINREKTLSLYDDGYVRTSPVGSFPPNEIGIFDLAGNAYEWVADDYADDIGYGVLRGGSWGTYIKEHLYVSNRSVVKPSQKSNLYGFRIALAKISSPTD
ncbi:MAG: SUMF1/EgtB/PvdO family nonheme iron enzyme [Akkermansiaceae bacterium]